MGAHILVVDDEPGIREMLTTWLHGAGHRCIVACDANEALAAMHAQPADVALLDLALPGMDGVWLARQLRESQRDTALIMVTGLQRFDAAVEGMRLGVLDYLLKPFTRRQLLDSINRAVEWRESTRRQKLEHARLQEEIDRRSEALSDTFTRLQCVSAGALESLLVTLHARNPDACAHGRRVAEMAVTLADALGVGGEERAHIERGALLHDIGKIAIPDALIHKPGPLTEEEIAVIRTHVQIGHDIIAVVPPLEEAARIVLCSHEAWDGSGYPAGYAGKQIPLGSRITAVVDTFDALTWGRVYRDAVSYARAAAELVRCAGTQFDPDVVHAWLRVAERFEPAVAQ
jgi:response regulator RpfG family c-di-GMP phosphodiesterase